MLNTVFPSDAQGACQKRVIRYAGYPKHSVLPFIEAGLNPESTVRKF